MATGKVISLVPQEQDKIVFDKSSLAGKNLHLSIEVRENILLACLFDKDNNEYLARAVFKRSKGQSLQDILKEEMLNWKCSGISVVFTHNSGMLIPSAFFSPESVKNYLQQQNLIKPGETPCSDFIKNNDCYSVYAVNTSDYNLLKEKYPHAVFRHHSSVFVEYLLASASPRSIKGSEVHACTFDGYMDIVALQQGKLILYNRYYFQTAEDFTYFLLWVYEELKLKQEDACIFYGEINEKSVLFTLAHKYLANARLAEKSTRFTFSPWLGNFPAHRYYSLFMQYLCI
jgi:hypothetical protein